MRERALPPLKPEIVQKAESGGGPGGVANDLTSKSLCPLYFS